MVGGGPDAVDVEDVDAAERVAGVLHGGRGEELEGRVADGLGDGAALEFEGEIAGYPVKDFYLTNPIARASAVMQQCSDELLHGADVKEAAE